MSKLFLIAGHSNSDPGAVAENVVGRVKESDLTKEQRDMVYHYFRQHNVSPVIFDDDKDSLSQVIQKVNNLIKPSDILIDFHFNAFNKKASGSEVFPNKNMLIASELVTGISSIMGIPNRGVKIQSESSRGTLGILKGIGRRILIETCFMDNEDDFESYVKNKHLVNQYIAETIERHIYE